ncbi:MAG: hypothetical protein AAFO87_14040, partial [Cyanobacteria bacterium J06607_6]
IAAAQALIPILSATTTNERQFGLSQTLFLAPLVKDEWGGLNRSQRDDRYPPRLGCPASERVVASTGG